MRSCIYIDIRKVVKRILIEENQEMSSTIPSRVNCLLAWLEDNGYWNNNIEIKPTKFGLGAFQKKDSNLTVDDILLRVPKSNVLSPKNSYIYNLVQDFVKDSSIEGLTDGMQGLILCVIYELSVREKSPWYKYLHSIDFESEEASIPMPLWKENDRKNLENSNADLLGILDSTEFLEFYNECVSFAATYSYLLRVPDVLNNDPEDPESQVKPPKIIRFGKILQGVISRAFSVDEYYGESLVPGADIYNHISPTVDVNGELTENETVNFVCDSGACKKCGEIDCGEHEDLMTDESDVEDDEERTLIKEDEEDSEENENDGEGNGEDILLEENERNEAAEEEEPIKEITIDYIARMEREMEENSDSDSEQSDFDRKETSEGISNSEPKFNDYDDDLANELSDNSKNCDIILIRKPCKQYDLEIFNTYGNQLSNIFLLHRYGFISPQNPNDFVLLSVEALRYVKQLTKNVSGHKKAHIKEKVEWLTTIGFDILIEIHQSQGGEDETFASSWELLIKILHDGECSAFTYVIINLLHLPYKYFKIISHSKLKKQASMFKKYAFNYNKNKIDTIIRQWCKEKLQKYPEYIPSENLEVIKKLVDSEKSLLTKYLNRH